jgi:DNA primase
MRLMPRYSNIYLFLDNDTAGKEACRRIQELRPDAENISQRIFPQYKDFNEFLLNQRS